MGSDTVDRESDEYITFKLWNISALRSKNSHYCEMDVTTVGETLLKGGDERTMRAFLSAANIRQGRPISWTIKAFCSQYYSDYPLGENWRDRLVRTWRVRIETDDPTLDSRYLHFGPTGVYAWDSTFHDEDNDWERGNEECTIIGEIDEGASLSFLDVLRNRYETSNIFPSPTRPSVQVRIHLGTLRLPESLHKVEQVIDLCGSHGCRMNWKETLR
ncbi:hypothetical protein GCM10023324_22400 [Streptomyces youssoufiensis]